MAGRDEIVAYANELLEVERWPEFAPAGLQVVGAPEVTTLACGVSSSRALFEERLRASGRRWCSSTTGSSGATSRSSWTHGCAGGSRLCSAGTPRSSPTTSHSMRTRSSATTPSSRARIGAVPLGAFGSLGLSCSVIPQSIETLTAAVEQVTGQPPLVLPGGPAEIRHLAVVSGGGGHDLIRAAHEGFDALLTGEPEEPSQQTRAGARESI